MRRRMGTPRVGRFQSWLGVLALDCAFPVEAVGRSREGRWLCQCSQRNLEYYSQSTTKDSGRNA